MPSRAPHPPIWLLGFGLWPLGVNGALLLITMPQLLAAQHTPENRIAAITTMARLAVLPPDLGDNLHPCHRFRQRRGLPVRRAAGGAPGPVLRLQSRRLP